MEQRLAADDGDAPRSSGVGVVDKAVSVLDAVAAGAMSLGELVEATGISRATAHRIAAALEVHSLLRRDDRGRYVIGWRLLALGRATELDAELADVARPFLARLRDVTGESVQLYVRDGDERVCVASLDSPGELRTVVAVGARLPLDRGSAGAALLAGRPGEWSQSVGERAAGVASVSAAVHDRAGHVVAALGVSGPIDRTTKNPGRRYGDDVVAAAAELTRALT